MLSNKPSTTTKDQEIEPNSNIATTHECHVSGLLSGKQNFPDKTGQQFEFFDFTSFGCIFVATPWNACLEFLGNVSSWLSEIIAKRTHCGPTCVVGNNWVWISFKKIDRMFS